MRLFFLTSLVMVAFAANSVLNRLALADGMIGPSAFAMIRVGSGALVLAVLVFWQDRRLVDLSEVSWVSTGALSLYVLGFSYAYLTLGAATGALILFGGVQITMFAGALSARENMPTARWIGAGIAFGGLVFLLAPSADAPALAGVVLMAAAALGWGIYSLYGRRIRRPLQATAANFLLSVPVALVVGLAVGDDLPIRAEGVGLAVLSGAVTSGLGYALWYLVLPRLASTVAAVAQLTVPVIALAGGMVFLGEVATVQFIIATALILGGVTISIRR